MRKNVLALSIAAMVGGFAGVAQAAVLPAAAAAATGAVLGTNVANEPGVAGTPATAATVLEVNPNNVGHMLVVPYYTAQNGNMSVIHLSNTDRANGKAVKIRFRGAANSDDVKDFQIFLSPGDVWTGAVLQGADGAATLYTSDNTCTVPAIPSTGTPFATSRLNAATNVNGTREGYVEIFNMADIPSARAYSSTVGASGAAAATGTAQSVLYTAIKHNNGVAPCSAAGSAARTLLNDIAMTNYTDAALAASVGFGGSTTGLSADWYILNLAQSTSFSGAATAIEARVAAAGAAGAANFVHFPQTDAGSAAYFAGANINNLTADPLLRTDSLEGATTPLTPRSTSVVQPLFIDLPDMSTPYLGGTATALDQAAALTTALARTSVSNQYALDAGISAATDWVFSMPTRRYSVAANYSAVAANGTPSPVYRVFSPLVSTTATSWFRPANTRVDARGNICVDAAGMRFFDREETTTGNAPIFSPAVASQLSFCGETSVLSFSGTKVLGSSSELTAATMTSPYVNGWTVVDTSNNVGTVATPQNLGLPIIGDAFIKLNNDSAGAGFKSTFGVTWQHRYGR